MKILITGILGYIGRGLCELYENSEHEIIGIDKEFDAGKVAWLTKRRIKYYHRDLFNCRDLLEDVDICYHLASETAVPTVKEQATPEIDAKILRVGIDGTKELINNLPNKTKILFASTHVIFEGNTNINPTGLSESDIPYPELAYSRSKRLSEIDLKTSNKNYIIARFASVYGHNPWCRWKILPNLFSKMASQNQNLKVFGNGNNIKPLIGIFDVCSAIKFLAENDYNKEIFHLVNEHQTVSEIAHICQNFNPNIKIEHTDDPIPNLGYLLSNKKLLKTGFKFQNNIHYEIGKMINLWSNK